MHGDHQTGTKIQEGPECLLRVHMALPKFGPVVSADRKEGNIRTQFAADFLKALEVGGVAGVVDGVATEIENVATVAPVEIGDLAGSPMLGGDKSDSGSGKAEAFPPFHLIHLLKAESVDQISHPGGNHNRLIGGDLTKTSAIEMVEMGMGDENEIDVG